MIGEYNQPARSRLTVRTIDLVTLTGVLDAAMEDGGLDAAADAYARYRADPVRGRENTAGEMIAYGYRFLSARQVPEALRFFGLNADTYPDNPAAQFHLGEAYRYIGRTDEAVAQYRKVLALDPEHANAASRLAQLAGD
jgi:tetratricopeptide (TPR) repeat protein